jgi:GntR family transcriptional regulator/MocR family aminotransferase
MRRLYEERQGIFLSELRQQLTDWLVVQPSDTGIQLVAYLRNRAELSAAAKRNDIVAVPLSRFFLGRRAATGLFLGYAATKQERIAMGVKKLARAFVDLKPV